MNCIVLVDENWGIGCDGSQNIFIKEDLKRFKALTQNTTVILGRKTLATFPKGKPLPNRRNLILSTNPQCTVEGAEVFSSISAVLSALTPEETVFVIGGASVYEAFLDHCSTVYVTKVGVSLPADCYFPCLDHLDQWFCSETSPMMDEDGTTYQYCTYQRH